MRKKTYHLFTSATLLLLSLVFTQAQELNASVSINYSNIQQSRSSQFKTLEKDIRTYLNSTSFTNVHYTELAKIPVKINLLLTKVSGDNYEAELQLQARRSVYNASYLSPLLNFKDSKFNFKHQEHQTLTFNIRRFSGDNLTDMLNYYALFIIGLDQDTFSYKGGNKAFLDAFQVAQNANNSNYGNWSITGGNKSRTHLIKTYLSTSTEPLRLCNYLYHRKGLDNLNFDQKYGYNNIQLALLKLGKIKTYSHFYPLDIFMNTKREEIANIYGENTYFNSNESLKIKTLLNKISPINKTYWDKF